MLPLCYAMPPALAKFSSFQETRKQKKRLTLKIEIDHFREKTNTRDFHSEWDFIKTKGPFIFANVSLANVWLDFCVQMRLSNDVDDVDDDADDADDADDVEIEWELFLLFIFIKHVFLCFTIYSTNQVVHNRGTGCSTPVENMSHHTEVAGSNSTLCCFFFSIIRRVSFIRSLKVMHLN